MARLLKLLRGGSFNPFSVGSPSLWLSSRYPSSLWKERTTPATQAILNGDVVGTWMDLSGNANHVTAPTDAARPTLTTGSLGGWPALLFDGTDDWMQIASGLGLSRSTSITMFLVSRFISTFGVLATFNDYVYELGRYYGGELIGRSTSASANGMYVSASSSPSLHSMLVDYAISGNDGHLVWLNGTSKALTYTGTKGVQTTNVLSSFTLGARSGGANPGNLNIYEVILFPAALTTSQRQYIERGLGRAYGITVA